MFLLCRPLFPIVQLRQDQNRSGLAAQALVVTMVVKVRLLQLWLYWPDHVVAGVQEAEVSSSCVTAVLRLEGLMAVAAIKVAMVVMLAIRIVGEVGLINNRGRVI